MNTNKKIVFRKYYAIRLKLASPLNISGGTSYNTDSDVLRNQQGELFIPGTAVAGALRNYLELAKKKAGPMGYSDGSEGRMSSIFIGDMFFEGTPLVTERDGIGLDGNKQVKPEAKFDMEIIETGAETTLYLNYMVREGENKAEFEKCIHTFLCELENGKIRLGKKKTRGFGKFKIQNVYEKEFEYTESSQEKIVEEWLSFNQNIRNTESYDDKGAYEKWSKDANVSADSKYVEITVPLKLNGGISIRKYSAEVGQADYQHITCNGQPVIPGSSWMGAIRSDAVSILKELNYANAEKYIQKYFGHVAVSKNKNDAKEAWQSNIIVEESILKDSVCMSSTRNKINRFDNSVKGGALYTEKAYFGGTTELKILVRKKLLVPKGYENDGEESYKGVIGLLSLVFEDLGVGYLAVGGLSSIGRGIFELNGKIKYSDGLDLDSCKSRLYDQLKEVCTND